MSGRILLDTGIVIAHFRNELKVSERLQGASALFLPAIALGELYTGAYRQRTRQQKALQTVDEFASLTHVLRTDADTDVHYGRLRSELMQCGTPIPDNDIWIAALSMQYQIPAERRSYETRFAPKGLKIETLFPRRWREALLEYFVRGGLIMVCLLVILLLETSCSNPQRQWQTSGRIATAGNDRDEGFIAVYSVQDADWTSYVSAVRKYVEVARQERRHDTNVWTEIDRLQRFQQRIEVHKGIFQLASPQRFVVLLRTATGKEQRWILPVDMQQNTLPVLAETNSIPVVF